MSDTWAATETTVHRRKLDWRWLVGAAVVAILVAQAFFVFQLRQQVESQDARLAAQSQEIAKLEGSLNSNISSLAEVRSSLATLQSRLSDVDGSLRDFRDWAVKVNAAFSDVYEAIAAASYVDPGPTNLYCYEYVPNQLSCS
jgi:septal ring factor EnvC (AmiA/AmiB activator)